MTELHQRPPPRLLPTSTSTADSRHAAKCAKARSRELPPSNKYASRAPLFYLASAPFCSHPDFLCRYSRPPIQDVTLEEFETWAIDRLKGTHPCGTQCLPCWLTPAAVLSEIESSFVRNRNHDELKTVTLNQCKKYLPLEPDNVELRVREPQRKKDHVSHFILRLAFCRS